jgi:hypothetical protein
MAVSSRPYGVWEADVEATSSLGAGKTSRDSGEVAAAGSRRAWAMQVRVQVRVRVRVQVLRLDGGVAARSSDAFNAGSVELGYRPWAAAM